MSIFWVRSVLSNEEIVRFWNAIALTDDEDRAMQALRLILGSDLERADGGTSAMTYHIKNLILNTFRGLSQSFRGKLVRSL